MRTSAILVPLLVGAVLFLGSCGTPAQQSGTGASDADPAETTRMICAPDAQREISLSLQLQLSRPVAPTWANHLYSCPYAYPVGTVVLSVKQLPDDAAAATYFTASHGSVARAVAVSGLGQAAYAEPDGSLVVRKDRMVLRVDVSGMPDQFGRPALSRAEAARRIGADIMNCWTGG